MKYINAIIESLLLCILFFSCGTTKKISKANELTLIKTSYEDGNIIYLIEALDKYPSYKGYIESYLYDYDYSSVDYSKLKKYANVAKNNAEASIFFDSLIINKQTLIIDSLSHLSVVDIGSFYKSNYIEHDYLKDVIRGAYFSDVQSLDYTNRKILYEVFRDTDLCSEIEKPYRDLRDSLLTDIMGVFNPYFESEQSLLKQIESAIRYESQKYIEAGLEKIIIAANEKKSRGFFKKLFQRTDIDKFSFSEYINNIINETYDCSFIEKLTNERLSEYLNSSKEMRSMLFNQYFDDHEYQNIYIPNDIKAQFAWIIGRDEVSNIQNIKDVGTALTIGSLALSFIPGGGALAFIVDGADLVYGLSQDDRINQAIEQLSSTIYNDSLLCIGDYLTNIFKDLTESQKTTENNIRKIFNDEF